MARLAPALHLHLGTNLARRAPGACTMTKVGVTDGDTEAEGSYAVVLRERKDQLSGVLMILDDKQEADDLAFELRRRHLDVIVMGWQPPGND